MSLSSKRQPFEVERLWHEKDDRGNYVLDIALPIRSLVERYGLSDQAAGEVRRIGATLRMLLNINPNQVDRNSIAYLELKRLCEAYPRSTASSMEKAFAYALNNSENTYQWPCLCYAFDISKADAYTAIRLAQWVKYENIEPSTLSAARLQVQAILLERVRLLPKRKLTTKLDAA